MNLLPILMTAINVVSSIIYTKGAPLREKIQTFALAGIFLVLLYNSPSGLVFYWVLNQIFSLCKNVVKKMTYPLLVLHFVLSGIFILGSILTALFVPYGSKALKYVIYIWTVLFSIAPFIWKKLKTKISLHHIERFSTLISDKYNFALFFTSCVSLWLLCGFLLPSSVISTGSEEFSFLGNTDSPLFYIKTCFVYFFGVFVFWPFVVYKLFNKNQKVKIIMPALFFILALCSITNVFLFKYDYGNVTIFFNLLNINNVKLGFVKYYLSPFLLLLFFIFCLLFLYKSKRESWMVFIIVPISVVELIFGCLKLRNINQDFSRLFEEHSKKKISVAKSDELLPELYFSKTEPNVIVFHLDRAVSAYFPYIMEQFPELNKKLEGFVYYPNCISFGGNTINASIAFMGGYDYIPQELRKDNRLLIEKHNNAILTLPKNFTEKGFDATLINIPYVNYRQHTDVDIFKDYNIVVKDLGREPYGSLYLNEHPDDIIYQNIDLVVKRNIKSFVVLQILYPPLRQRFCNSGKYYNTSRQNMFDSQEGNVFFDEYAKLYFLPKITNFSSKKPTYTFIENATPHDSARLCPPDYRPNLVDRYSDAGCGLYHFVSDDDYGAYQCNVAAILQIAKWMDFFKDNDAYDNTRIIIAGDHGALTINDRFLDFKKVPEAVNFNPLFLIKDFGAHGDVSTDNTFVSNAETPYFATKGLDVSNINSFTGNKFRQASDFDTFEIVRVTGTDNDPSAWLNKTEFRNKRTEHYIVHNNIFDEANWTRIDKLEASK